MKIQNARPINRLFALFSITIFFLFPQYSFADGCCERLSSPDKPSCSDPSCVSACFTMPDQGSCDAFGQTIYGGNQTKTVQWNSGKCWGLPECKGNTATSCCIVKNGDYVTCYATQGTALNKSACDALGKGKGATDVTFSSDACNAGNNNSICGGHLEDPNMYGEVSSDTTVIPGTNIKAPTLAEPKLIMNIPGLAPFTAPGGNYQQGYLIPWIGQYIGGIYTFLTGIVGTVAITMIIFGGVKWIMAGGDSSKIASARANISNAIIGLLLAFGTYLILYTLNPALVQFQALKIQGIKQITIDKSMDSQLGGASIEDATSAASTASANGPVPIFKQAGAPWGSKVYGNCPTEGVPAKDLPYYGNAGCGPTSVAMIVKSLGKDVDPEKMGTWATKIGARVCGNGTGANIYTQINSLFNDLQGEIIDGNKAYSLLSSGKPIGFLTGNYKSLGGCYVLSGHFMVATGIDGDWVNINDPALCGMRGDKGTADKIELNEKSAGYGIKRMKKELFLQGASFFYIHQKQ